MQNKLTRAQYLDEVTWTTKNWLGLQKQRISVVQPIAEQVVNELACGGVGGCTELSASPPSQESLRRLPWCTCVSASVYRAPVRASPVPSVVRGSFVVKFWCAVNE